jgi:hypothetical protein
MNLHESEIAAADADRPSSWFTMFGPASYIQRPDLLGQFLANFSVLNGCNELHRVYAFCYKPLQTSQKHNSPLLDATVHNRFF